MERKSLILIFYFCMIANIQICVSQAHSQPYLSGFDQCSGKVVWITNEWKKTPEINYNSFKSNYILEHFPGSIRFAIPDTGSWVKYNNIFGSPELMYYRLRNDSIDSKVVVFLSEKKHLIDPKFINDLIYNYLNTAESFLGRMENTLGYKYFGYIYQDSIVTINTIDSIQIDIKNSRVVVKDSIFNKLIDPNLFSKLGSYKPIEVFYDSSKELVILYIMGEVNVGINDVLHLNEYSFYKGAGSYVSKIIINIASQEVSNITIPSYILWSFGWPYCENFWAF